MKDPKKNFKKESLRIMLDTNCWKIACSQLPIETPKFSTREHDEWLKTHTDKHWHREVLLVLKGNSLISLNGASYLASPGCLFLFDEFEEHDFGYNLLGQDIDHLWLYLFKNGIFARVITIRNHRLGTLGHDLIIKNNNLLSLEFELWHSLKNSNLATDLKRQKLISIIYLFMLELVECDEKYDNTCIDKKNYQKQKIYMIKDYIVNASGKNLTIDQLAKIAGYSKFHFLRLFKLYMGKSVHSYIDTVRISKTKNMLKDGFQKKEIAEELGFSSASAFSLWLKRNSDSL